MGVVAATAPAAVAAAEGKGTEDSDVIISPVTNIIVFKGRIMICQGKNHHFLLNNRHFYKRTRVLGSAQGGVERG